MVVALIVPSAVCRISIMRWRMHVNVIRAGKTAKPPRRRSRNRAIRLSGKTRVVQIRSPCVGGQHGRRIWVAMGR
eukprot:3411799-Pyramimonas_sp.AAC.1